MGNQSHTPVVGFTTSLTALYSRPCTGLTHLSGHQLPQPLWVNCSAPRRGEGEGYHPLPSFLDCIHGVQDFRAPLVTDDFVKSFPQNHDGIPLPSARRAIVAGHASKCVEDMPKVTKVVPVRFIFGLPGKPIGNQFETIKLFLIASDSQFLPFLDFPIRQIQFFHNSLILGFWRSG